METLDVKTLGKDLDGMLRTLVESGSLSGSALVAQNGEVILSGGYGFADIENRTLNTAQTRFRIYSITKGFTAMAVLMLQERGKLRVQDGICEYLANCPVAWEPITIHQLLTHTSGLPELFEAYATQEIASPESLDRWIADTATRPLVSAPGAQFRYCVIGYVLLGKVIETVSGQSYEAFLRENIFEPLQMSSTGYDHNRDDLAIGYTEHGRSVAAPVNMSACYSAGALYSTVQDLFLWDQALYTHTLVQQEALDAMLTAHVPAPDLGPGWSYGYGWCVGPQGQRRLVLHPGGLNGYRSIINRYLADHATIIILSNWDDTDPAPIADAMAAKLFGEE